jgi:tRNA dimethylallyltransferase
VSPTDTCRGIVAIVGPTASGKSRLALEVAAAAGAEIVSTDAYCVYQGMDIGTAKPSAADRDRVRHHCIDLVPLSHPMTVAEFQGHARRAIADCRRRGVAVVVTGGSALYVRAVLDRFDFPGTDPAVRARLGRELDQRGVQAMHDRLTRLDPEAGAAIGPTNARRVVRALEVIELTGRPFRATLPEPHYVDPDTLQLGIRRPLADLDLRIERRVRQMWRDGLVEEVRALLDDGLAQAPTASRALGYGQVIAMLEGRSTAEEALDATVTATRRFARRQLSWFRRDTRIHWLSDDESAWLDEAMSYAGWAGA